MSHEAEIVTKSGFNLGLTNRDVEINEENNYPSSGKRSKKWRHGISKEAEKRIAKAKELDAVVLEENVMEDDQIVKFSIFTEEKYEVHIKKEPCCSCADFQSRESRNKSFLACKHMYFVYLRVLGLDEHQFMCIHQPTLQDRDLRLILNQERKIVALDV